ncbi:MULTISPECIES: aspartate/glutamate racemase family protein [unclassified Corynebacterium]|uniref:aspartate/glutamate racemase family protein n=1 Tax=unclassified Corynebacterium TaxID=2624378 RepID=UPI0026483359|nr:aspartate/glutamate racemase family protein [Corynebacterium sp.]MDN5581623.1 aspartate/glutamate racemase family protein [Corynebacterium sp.]MDN5720581.1 aspartate/glutamate racemase family protein [Corynebacterium sp.]MDN6326138.1 aspartate/glutamate racemase family protein [Corynebacterium sp.]
MTRRILLVNPNTNQSTTAMMARRLRAALGPDAALAEAPGCVVTAVTAARGPAMITTPDALQDAAGHVVDAVRGALQDAAQDGSQDGSSFDAVLVGAFGDPGVRELRHLPALDGVLVTGIGEAALLAATAAGGRFAIATTTGELAGSLAELVARVGVAESYTGLELTRTDPLVLATSPQASRCELAVAVERAVTKGADRVVIGGGPLSDVAAELESTYPGVIVEPVVAAARLIRGA